MYWIWIISMAMVLKSSLAFPIGSWSDTALGFDLTTDHMTGFYGPWSPDYLHGNRWLSPWAPSPYWSGPPSHPLDFGYPPGLDMFPRTPDYYAPYPKVGVAKEKYVRDYPYGETEVGVRDSMTMAPGLMAPGLMAPGLMAPGFGGSYYNRWSTPHAWPGSGYYPHMYGYDWPAPRMYSAGFGTPRPSSLRNGGDFMYLRR